jgi:hypothetical protein
MRELSSVARLREWKKRELSSVARLREWKKREALPPILLFCYKSENPLTSPSRFAKMTMAREERLFTPLIQIIRRNPK